MDKMVDKNKSKSLLVLNEFPTGRLLSDMRTWSEHVEAHRVVDIFTSPNTVDYRLPTALLKLNPCFIWAFMKMRLSRCLLGIVNRVITISSSASIKAKRRRRSL